MRISRKLKKRIIKTFGRGTYFGIIEGVLKLQKYDNNKGVIVKYTGKPLARFYYASTYNPYLIFPDINLYNECNPNC